LKLPLDYEVLIPYDSEVRTFDEVFRRIEIKKYLVEGSPKGLTGYNPVNMFKLILFLEGYYEAYGEYPKYPVADAGYGGLKNYRYVKSNHIEIVQKYTMYGKDTLDKKWIVDPARPVNFKKDAEGNYIDANGEKPIFRWHSKKGHDVYEAPISKKQYDINEELWAFQKEARENLVSDDGIELRIQRSIQVEGTFGVLKEDFRFRRFRRRGIQNVKFEFLLLAIGYNLSKHHNKKYRVTA